MAGRAEFDEHEGYVGIRAAIETAEKLGIVVDDSCTPQELVWRSMLSQQAALKALRYEDEADHNRRQATLAASVDEQRVLAEQSRPLKEALEAAVEARRFERCVDLQAKIKALSVDHAVIP